MENKQEDKNNETKLFFGLSSRATIINIIILTFISSYIWAYKFVEINKGIVDSNQTQEVPWYWSFPFLLVPVFMTFRWVDYTFKLEKGSFLSSPKNFRISLIACLSLSLLSSVFKSISLYFLLIP